MQVSLTRALRVLAGSVAPGSSNGKTAMARLAAATDAGLPLSSTTHASRRSRSHGSSALFEPLEDRTLMSTTYFVSPSGSDNNSGTSASSPWKSISKVNSHGYGAGDNILFQGGQTFGGSLLSKNQSGSSSAPITYGSYGSGKATISSGGSDGLYEYNDNNLTVENLNFVGNTSGGPNQFGIKFEAGSGSSRSNLSVINVSASGFDGDGVYFQTDGNGSTLNGVTIKNSSFFNNVYAGIRSNVQQNNTIHNVYIGYNQVYNNYGASNDGNCGNGMWLAGLNGATVEYNNVHDNGDKHGNANSGIMTTASTGIVVQYNIVDNTVTTTSADGDGIDFDLDTQNSVMQYNYTYGNDGSGLMFDQWQGNGQNKNNIARFNISQNDARRNTYAGFTSFGQVDNSYVYNNVIYMNGGNNSSGILVKYSTLGGSYVQGLHFSNNVIMTGNRPLITVPGNELHGSNITFTGNVYDAFAGSTRIIFGSTYGSLASFASSTGQEKVGSKVVGLQTNPEFVSAGNAPALSSPTQLQTLTAYELTKSSPIVGHGVNVSSLYGVADVSKDFYGHSISASTAVIGADAVSSSLTATPIATTNGNGSSGSSSTSSTGSTSGSSSSGSSSSSSSGSSSSGSSSSKTGTVSGTITENGKALAGVTVYLDPQNAVKYESGDRSTTTSSSGTYSFTGVSVGANIVRQILPSGVSQVLPSRGYGNHITVSSGSTISNQNFTDVGGISTALPTGWTSADIGSVDAKGTATYINGVYALSGSGDNISGNDDEFRFAYTTLHGNGQIVAELDALSDVQDWTKGGLMIRDGTGANAKNVALVVTPTGGAQQQSRTSVGGSTAISKQVSSVKSPEWLKLVRSGNVITGYLSKDDKTWTKMSATTVSMNSTVEIGLAVSSHDNGTLAAAAFSNVAVS